MSYQAILSLAALASGVLIVSWVIMRHKTVVRSARRQRFVAAEARRRERLNRTPAQAPTQVDLSLIMAELAVRLAEARQAAGNFDEHQRLDLIQRYYEELCTRYHQAVARLDETTVAACRTALLRLTQSLTLPPVAVRAYRPAPPAPPLDTLHTSRPTRGRDRN